MPGTISVSIFIQGKILLKGGRNYVHKFQLNFALQGKRHFSQLLIKDIPATSEIWISLCILGYSAKVLSARKNVVEACFINILLLFLDYTPVEAHICNDTSDSL